MGAITDAPEPSEPASPGNAQWQRVSPFGMFAFTNAGPVLFIYIGIMLYAIADQPIATTLLIVAGIALIFVLASLLFWMNFSYQIGADGVRIRKGVFKKSQVFIRYSRVQGVELTSTLVYRALGLVLAKLDTAGTAKQEGTLPGITPDIAALLQEKVRAARLETANEDATSSTQDTTTPLQGSASEEWLNLQAPEIIRIGLTSSHVFLFLGFVAAFIEPAINFGMSTLLPDWAVEKGLNVWRSVGVGVLASLIGGIAITTIVAMFAGSLASAFLRFFNFTLTKTDQQLKTNAGLFTVREQSVHQSKVQTMTVRQSWPRKLLNRVAIDLRQASSAMVKNQKQQANQSKLLIPLTEPSLIHTVREFALTGRGADLELERDSTRFVPISARYVRARTLLIGVLPVLGFLPYPVLEFISASWFALAATIWIAITLLLALMRYRRWGVQAGEDTVAIRNGFLGHQITCFACEKVQSINLTAHWFQERAGVTNLTIHLASQNITVPYLPYDTANTLHNYLLYKIESTNAQTI